VPSLLRVMLTSMVMDSSVVRISVSFSLSGVVLDLLTSMEMVSSMVATLDYY
jgi:hypothetical protein